MSERANDPSDTPRMRDLAPAARRALAEAEERRRQAATEHNKTEGEKGGPKGPEPTRFGDWERGGRAVDF